MLEDRVRFGNLGRASITSIIACLSSDSHHLHIFQHCIPLFEGVACRPFGMRERIRGPQTSRAGVQEFAISSHSIGAKGICVALRR